MKESFKQYYFLYFDDLCRFANFYTSDMHVAEDAVQQVFLGLWEAKTDFKRITNPKSYLLRSVKNQVLNDQRKSDMLKRLEHEDVDSGFDIDDQLVGKELQERIEILIKALPPKRQYIFRLSRQEDKTHKEIAALMEIAPKTVENQIGKAIKFLRENIYKADN